MHQLEQEIKQQPDVLRGLLDTFEEVETIAAQIRARNIQHVLIAARGTSDNAAVYAKYLFGSLNRLPVALAAPSLYTLYGTPPSLASTLVVGISQSGMSPDIVVVLQEARKQGMLTLAITNDENSRLARIAECVLLCRAERELSVAATKTYTAELMLLAMLSAALAEDETRRQQLAMVPKAVSAALGLDAEITRAVERYCYVRGCSVVARGFNYATAFEIALKIKELTYTNAIAYSSADFRHGPIAVVEAGHPVLAIAPQGDAFQDMQALCHELEQRRADVILISDDSELLDQARTPLPISLALPEWLSPIACVVPGQLFAYRLTLARGLNPDHPRGLRKVTETL